jgi:hypothetical protein
MFANALPRADRPGLAGDYATAERSADRAPPSTSDALFTTPLSKKLEARL